MRTSDRTEIRAFTNPCYRAIEIHVLRGDTYATDITWEDLGPLDGVFKRPVLTLDYAACQALMDSLYTAGFRSSASAGSAGQKEALERHLEDMRTLAFKHLEIEKP